MFDKKTIVLLLPVIFIFFSSCHKPQKKEIPEPFNIIAYYHGEAESIDAYPVEKLSHIIFSFCHLKGNRLSVDDAGDSLTIRKLVGLKKRNPNLKVMLALGGWGGCETCSDVFSTESGRKEFAISVKELQEEFKTDGIDLDWEYPGISGFPGHKFKPEDTPNFTMLVKELRNTLGDKTEISFAAGAFDRFFNNSCEWGKAMPLVDRVNLMTYDFFTGGSLETGHHTSLYSNSQQKRSGDYAVRFLDSIGVAKNKMVIGAAFYGRIWEEVENKNNGLYQPAKGKVGMAFKNLDNYFTENPGYNLKWDTVSHAPYAHDSINHLFITYDNKESVKSKTLYARRSKLNGIMFWQLGSDKNEGGLLDAIYDAAFTK